MTGNKRASTVDVRMHRFSPVNGISDSPSECHFFAGKLCDESNEDGLNGRQLQMRSAEDAG